MPLPDRVKALGRYVASHPANDDDFDFRVTGGGEPPEPRCRTCPQQRSWLAGEYLRAYGPARVEDFARLRLTRTAHGDSRCDPFGQ